MKPQTISLGPSLRSLILMFLLKLHRTGSINYITHEPQGLLTLNGWLIRIYSAIGCLLVKCNLGDIFCQEHKVLPVRYNTSVWIWANQKCGRRPLIHALFVSHHAERNDFITEILKNCLSWAVAQPVCLSSRWAGLHFGRVHFKGSQKIRKSPKTKIKISQNF